MIGLVLHLANPLHKVPLRGRLSNSCLDFLEYYLSSPETWSFLG